MRLAEDSDRAPQGDRQNSIRNLAASLSKMPVHFNALELER